MLPLLLSTAIFLSPIQTTAAKEVTLQRVSKANEKLDYGIKSHIQVDVRGRGLETWLPSDIDISYSFSSVVKEVKPGGMMVMHYLRPTMTEDIGETVDSQEHVETERVNLDYLLTLSPINEIVAEKNLAPPKPAKAGNEDEGGGELLVRPLVAQGQMSVSMLDFVREIYQLALNVGSMDSALDFSPKLPIDDVKPGDTWKKTVGFTPQRLKDKKNTSAVQRLDYTYTYIGIQQVDGKPVYRVTADLNLQTNLADFFFQTTGLSPADTMIKSIGLNLKSHIDFDLDTKTGETLRAVSQSSGGFNIMTTDSDQALHEERFKGNTEMDLVHRS